MLEAKNIGIRVANGMDDVEAWLEMLRLSSR